MCSYLGEPHVWMNEMRAQGPLLDHHHGPTPLLNSVFFFYLVIWRNAFRLFQLDGQTMRFILTLKCFRAFVVLRTIL